MNARIFTSLAAILLMATIWAQSPEKMSYQAVIRNSSNQLVTDQAIGMQISILKGSASGTAVYTETQTPTTNANGLVSIEIGGDDATIVSGSFSSIDWASGTYYIKTETDPEGGTSYTITGTSQLLSVPYALHAKTAEMVTGTITETDPVYSSSVAGSITETDIANWNNKPDSYTETDPVFAISPAVNITGTDIVNLGNLSGSNTGDQDISGIAVNTQAIQDTASQIRSDIPDVSGFISTETDPVYGASVASGITATDTAKWNNKQNKLTAGTGIDITGNVISTTDTPLAIGDSYGGGIIFWLDASGNHGLIAATTDQSTGIQWYNGSNSTTGATPNAVYAGKTNTETIISNQGAGSYAAQLCDNYKVTVNNEYYDDWYLPSKYELNLMYLQRATIGSFASTYYWSSTEYGNFGAWGQTFNGGYQNIYYKDTTVIRVRAIRAF